MRGAVSDGRPYRDTNMLVMLLCRDATYVTSPILPIRNVNLTSLPIARIVLMLKAELVFADHRGVQVEFPRTTCVA